MGRVFFNTRENLDTTSLPGTDTYVMLESDSGKTFMVSGGTQAVTLLPAADLVEGWRCRFVTSASPSGAKTLAAGSAIIHGTHQDPDTDKGAGTDGTAVSNLLIAAAGQAGNFCELFTDGSLYYFNASASQDAAFV